MTTTYLVFAGGLLLGYTMATCTTYRQKHKVRALTQALKNIIGEQTAA